MLKLLLAITILCILEKCMIVSTKQLKPKATSWRANSGGLRKDHQNSNRTYLMWGDATWNALQKTLKLPSNQICAIIGGIEYICEDGVCCTPGSPESLCCPLDHPLCVDDGCCAIGHPKVCGLYCCEEDDTCCPNGCCEELEACCGVGCCDATDVCCLDHCCDTGDSCCGSGCCESGETCCGGNSCCKQNETCCGGDCCSENQTCCTEGGEEKCCNKTTSESCSSELYEYSCPYQFDALQCSEISDWKHFSLETSTQLCPDTLATRVLYRVLRQDESCYDGLKAKAPYASESALSFVNCGSKKGYASQFISTTSSLDVARSYQNATKSVKIAEIDVNEDLLATCRIVNLVNIGERKKHLRNAKSSKFAAAACEYLLTCKARIPCKEL